MGDSSCSLFFSFFVTKNKIEEFSLCYMSWAGQLCGWRTYLMLYMPLLMGKKINKRFILYAPHPKKMKNKFKILKVLHSSYKKKKNKKTKLSTFLTSKKTKKNKIKILNALHSSAVNKQKTNWRLFLTLKKFFYLSETNCYISDVTKSSTASACVTFFFLFFF